MSLQYASAEMKNDKEVVLAAVKQDGYSMSLQYASADLKNDKEVVLAAVKQEGSTSARWKATDETKKLAKENNQPKGVVRPAIGSA